ncbi:MAG: GDSL-type esterase/lipase family protein [Planctomycetota bacterium JB042]
MRGVRPALAIVVAALGTAACGVDHEALPNFHVAEGETIVFLGDSLTAGARLGKERAYPALLAAALPYEIVNAGENGDTTADALARFDRDVASRDPAIVVVLIGGNDGLRRGSREAARANVTRIVERIVDVGAVPVVVGFDMGLFGAGFTAFLAEVADATGALYLDDVLDDVLRSPSLKIDRVHPNEEGHARIAAALEEPLLALIAALEAR